MKIHPNSTCNTCIREDCPPKNVFGHCSFKEVSKAQDCTNCGKNTKVCYECDDDNSAWIPKTAKPLSAAENKEKLISELLKSEKIKRSYKIYIVKTIPFEKWVRDMVDRNFEVSEGYSYESIERK